MTTDAPRVAHTRGGDTPYREHRSGMRIQIGVSGDQSGSREVFMTRQIVPAGMRSTPHYHANCETAIFILSGPVIMHFGETLAESQRAEAGDFLYIPPNAVHQLVNPSEREDAEVVLCRNAAEEIVVEVEIRESEAAPGG